MESEQHEALNERLREVAQRGPIGPWLHQRTCRSAALPVGPLLRPGSDGGRTRLMARPVHDLAGRGRTGSRRRSGPCGRYMAGHTPRAGTPDPAGGLWAGRPVQRVLGQYHGRRPWRSGRTDPLHDHRSRPWLADRPADRPAVHRRRPQLRSGPPRLRILVALRGARRLHRVRRRAGLARPDPADHRTAEMVPLPDGQAQPDGAFRGWRSSYRDERPLPGSYVGVRATSI